MDTLRGFERPRRRRAAGRVAVLTLVALTAGVVLAPPAAATAPKRLVATPLDDITPALGHHFLLWSRGRGFQSSYDVVAQRHDGTRFLVNLPGTAGFAGGVDGNALIYQQITRVPVHDPESDLWWANLKTGKHHRLSEPISTGAWEWRPTVSGNWLLFGRESRSGSDIRLFNLDTREMRVLASSQFSLLAPGQISGRYAVWTAWHPGGTDVHRYDLVTGTQATIPRPDSAWGQYAASVTSDGTVYMIRAGSDCGEDVRVVRRTLDGTEQVLAEAPDGVDSFDTYAEEVSSHLTRVVLSMTRGCGPNANIYQVRDEGQTATTQLTLPGPSPSEPVGSRKVVAAMPGGPGLSR